ncbi:MAG: long-chain fatty acid--CoA ligase [Acidobacteria bacterium]|nr:long-chain fatty acid--CoA ligase [Acidobacteriota bacterium]
MSNNLAGFESIPQTIPHYCFESWRRHRKQNALAHKVSDKWDYIPGPSAIARVKRIAFGLAMLGVKRGDRLAIISENRPEWSLVDLAILSLGAVNVPIYTTQAVEQIRFILENSGARFLFVSGKKIWRHAEAAVESVESLEKVVFFDSDETTKEISRGVTLEQIEQDGDKMWKHDPELVENSLAAIQPDDLATIIYTSGTTGEPKGVMLTHNNFVSNIVSISKGLPIRSTDCNLSVLPLSHIFERTVFYVLCANGVSVHYCESFDKLATYLQEVKPTIMTAVPRLFEQVYHKIVKKGQSAGGFKTKLFEWSLGIGQEYWTYKDKRESVPAILAAKHSIADRLVYSKWRDAVGGELRFFVSGGAPLSKKLSYAFWAAGIQILQGYGMTEGCVVCANRPDDNKVGSIGRPFDGIEMKIGAQDEVLIKGPNIMTGYYNNPEATAAVLDPEGYYHTGDVGYEDRDGHFYITDRLKDLFKLSNGKYVAPLQVESLLKQSPLVSQAVVVGSGRKQVGALIVPDWDALKDEMKAAGAATDSPREELAVNSDYVKRVQQDAVDLTRELSDYERVKRVYLIPREFSIDKGEMTPTLKIKRSVIDEKYSEIIDEICGG